MRESHQTTSADAGRRRARVSRGRLLSRIISLSLLAALLTGCTGKATPLATMSVPAEPTEASVPSPAATTASEKGFTIRGTVMDASASARIIMLEEPDQGFSTIALTDETALLSADGGAIGLTDVRHGDSVKAHGQSGMPGTLLADEIVVGTP